MRKLNGTFTILGIILIVIQVLGIASVSFAKVGLYPRGENVDYVSEVQAADLDFQKITCAAVAGIDRLVFSIEEMITTTEDITKEEADVIIEQDIWYETEDKENFGLTPIQIQSAHNREDLGCGRGLNISLIIYDIIVTISFCMVGIIGALLVVIPNKLRPKSKHIHYHDEK